MKRSDKELLIASKAYARESRFTSWWHLISTSCLLLTLCFLASTSSNWFVCLSSSFLAGLLVVRVFILYHDFLHGAILKNSWIANAIFHLYGWVVLSPPAIWKYTHDDHHKNNCRSFGAQLGTFPTMTTVDYAAASKNRQMGYRIVRNPLVIVFGYFTSFLWNKCVRNLVRDPVKNYSAGIAIAVHLSLMIAIGSYSLQALIFGMVLPLFIGSGLGSYLFYAQHNFPGMTRKQGNEWNYVDAALLSSSYMQMSRLMHWFTGNIGYHHVHHLNSKIPFYRLPQAMSGLEELQQPKTTTLSVGEIARCLRLKLWDPDQQCMLTFSEAKLQAKM